MWKRIAIAYLAVAAQTAILDWVNSIDDAVRKSYAIALLRDMKAWLSNSRSKTTRAFATLLPFEID